MHVNVSFSIKLQVASWKKTPVQVRYCEFYCVISKNGYLVEHVQTIASDILGYTYVGSCKSILRKCRVFSSILALIHFKLILESCTTSRVHLEPYQISMMKCFCKNIQQLLATVFDRVLYTVLQASFFYIFPLSSVGYLNERYEHFVIIGKGCSYFPHMM